MVWLSSEELIILGLVVLEELDMSESVMFSDGVKGVKVSWGCWRWVVFKFFYILLIFSDLPNSIVDF